MKITSNHLRSYLRSVQLSSDERTAMRAAVSAFVTAHPAAEGATRTLRVRMPRPFAVSAAAVVVAVLGFGGVGFAAESALPGDLLYGVKVGVNETVRSRLSFSVEMKAAWEARRAERRLEEAERLASEGRLNAQIRNDLAERFAASASAVGQRVAELETEGKLGDAAGISSNFEATLKAHSSILRQTSDAGDQVRPLVVNVEEEADDAEDSRSKIERKIEADKTPAAATAAAGKRTAAQKKVDEVRQFVAKMKAREGAAATAEAEIKVTKATAILADGDAARAAGEYGRAFRLYQQALRIAQEAKLLVNARGSLKIDVKIDDGDQPRKPEPEGDQDRQGQPGEQSGENPEERQEEQNSKLEREGNTEVPEPRVEDSASVELER